MPDDYERAQEGPVTDNSAQRRLDDLEKSFNLLVDTVGTLVNGMSEIQKMIVMQNNTTKMLMDLIKLKEDKHENR